MGGEVKGVGWNVDRGKMKKGRTGKGENGAGEEREHEREGKALGSCGGWGLGLGREEGKRA